MDKIQLCSLVFFPSLPSATMFLLVGSESFPHRLSPTPGWQYIDPKNQIQGPFSLLEMQQWCLQPPFCLGSKHTVLCGRTNGWICDVSHVIYVIGGMPKLPGSQWVNHISLLSSKISFLTFLMSTMNQCFGRTKR